MYEQAKYPQRVFVGVCQQNKEGDDDCLSKCREWAKNVRVARLKHTDAKGPTYARYVCATLYKGEDFFFQIDSHTKFVSDWDARLIRMIEQIEQSGLSHRPIISHYPRTYEEADSVKAGDTHVPLMCRAFWNSRGMLSFQGAETSDTENEPRRHYYLAGGMLFARGAFLHDVPYDPLLPYLFVGEEILHSARAYTAGYDVFNPTENIVFHFYTREKENKIWTDNPTYSDMDAFNKAKFYLGLDGVKAEDLSAELRTDLELYGMGTRRTLAAFYADAGIDVVKKRVYSNFCRADGAATEAEIKNSNEALKEGFFDFKYTKRRAAFILFLFVVLLVIFFVV